MVGFLVFNNKNEVLLLFRDKWGHWETPGGKAEPGELVDLNKPTDEELRSVALRELHEELIGDFKINQIEYFGFQDFDLHDGRSGRTHKFIACYQSG